MCQQLARSVCHQSGRKRNMSPLHLTAFKPTRKASRYSNAKPQVAGELQSPCPSYPFLTRDLQPQERKWPPIQIPKEAKQGVFSSSLTPPSRWTLPAPSLQCSTFCNISGVHALSRGIDAGPLSLAPKCLECLDHFLSINGHCAPVLKGKQLQIAYHNSASFS